MVIPLIFPKVPLKPPTRVGLSFGDGNFASMVKYMVLPIMANQPTNHWFPLIRSYETLISWGGIRYGG